MERAAAAETDLNPVHEVEVAVLAASSSSNPTTTTIEHTTMATCPESSGPGPKVKDRVNDSDVVASVVDSAI